MWKKILWITLTAVLGAAADAAAREVLKRQRERNGQKE